MLSAGCKSTFTTSHAPAPYSNPSAGRERVAEVAARRTVTSPGPWPLVHLVSGVVNGLLRGGSQKNIHTSPGPWPLIIRISHDLIRLYIRRSYILPPRSCALSPRAVAAESVFVAAAPPSLRSWRVAARRRRRGADACGAVAAVAPRRRSLSTRARSLCVYLRSTQWPCPVASGLTRQRQWPLVHQL